MTVNGVSEGPTTGWISFVPDPSIHPEFLCAWQNHGLNAIAPIFIVCMHRNRQRLKDCQQWYDGFITSQSKQVSKLPAYKHRSHDCSPTTSPDNEHTRSGCCRPESPCSQPMQCTAGRVQLSNSSPISKTKVRRGGRRYKGNSFTCYDNFSILLNNIRSYNPRSASLNEIVKKTNPSLVFLNEVNLPKKHTKFLIHSYNTD